MRARLGHGLVSIALVLAASPSAFAQQTDTEHTTSPTEEQLIAAGVALRKQGDDAGALALFDRANALHPSARAAAQRALANQALARWCEAEHGLADALRDVDDPWIARNREALANSRAAVEERVGWLDVNSNAVGATLWVDGVFVASLPLERPACVPIGTANVELRASGYGPSVQRIRIDPNSIAHASFAFVTPVAAALPAAVSTPPPRDASPRAPSGRRAAAWVASGVAGGLALVGVAGLVAREAEARVYDDDAQCGPSGGLTRYDRCGTHRDIGSAAQTVAIVAFGSAGLAAAVSGVLFLIRDAPRISASPTGRVDCHWGVAAFSCAGSF